MKNAFKHYSPALTKKTQQKYQVPLVNLNQDDFPDLVNNSTQLLDKEPNKSLDYKGASLMNNGEQEEKKQPGWTYITMDKNRKIQIENYKIHPKYITKPKKEPNWRTILGQLVTSWETYKQQYVELYGEDCYNHMYEMPRDDYKYYHDENEYNDEISSVDEEDYYDENLEDYDNY